MPRILSLLLAVLFVLPLQAQTIDITFRYVTENPATERVFFPGSFNAWGGPYNASNCIQPGHASEASFVRFENYWAKTVALQAGQRYEYKVQIHTNTSATACSWLTDPLNPEVNASDNNNSVLVVADPMTFQVAEELSSNGTVRYFSAGLFGTEAFTNIEFTINGIVRSDGLDFFDADTGVFRFPLDTEVRAGSQFIIAATDAAGRTVSADIGELQPPIEWVDGPFRTLKEIVELRGFITRLDGTVDPSITEAVVIDSNGGTSAIPVENGLARGNVRLALGENIFRLSATVEGQTYESDPLTITRWIHPLNAMLVDAEVTGGDFVFDVAIVPRQNAPSDLTATWSMDEQLSTTDAVFSGVDLVGSGTATGPGEVYVDVVVESAGEEVDRLRIAVLIGEDGSVRPMAYAENAEWTKKAVVYEIFPLMFGDEARGTVTNPGDRLQEMTAELDYVAEMGFTAIWLMPIMRNRNGMTALGAGYNIIDFRNVDERLGTNADFKAFIDRAHELGIRVVLDITPSHASPDHPWVNSLREGGVYSEYIQTEPSAHNRGLDNRVANLPEIWQVDGGRNLYRKYDGFGDLANLNWDSDDLQAEFLDILAHWIREYDIDGYRIDVWWGPWRRYGPERFGRPVREIVKRLRPDAWILGEVTGTGENTEVYYADDQNGVSVIGGIDAGYDWRHYFGAIRGSYGNINEYHTAINAFGFYPGPNSRYFRFLENHDEPRIAWLYRNNLDRIKSLTGMLLTTPGVPMVYAGQEVAFGTGSDFSRRFPVDWETPRNGEFAELYQRLSRIRGAFPAFWTQEIDPLLLGRSNTDWVYAFARPYLDENAIVAINFDDEPTTFTIDPSNVVDWSTDGPIPYFDVAADTMNAYIGEFTVTLGAHETVVYITSDQPDFEMTPVPALPFGAINTAAEDQVFELPKRAALHAAYPNPFNPSTRLGFEVAQTGPVRLEVFDLLGRRVALLVDRVMTRGAHQATFDASRLTSGTYVYRLTAGPQVISRSVVLVK